MIYLPFGYIDMFMGISLASANFKPLRCRLKGAPTASIITLVDGTALNIDGETGSAPRFPVEQVFEVAVVGLAAGGGALVDTFLNQIGSKAGKQGVLRILVPNSVHMVYYCQAVLDYAEIVVEGNMRSNSGVNWTVVKLVFQQMAEFYE